MTEQNHPAAIGDVSPPWFSIRNPESVILGNEIHEFYGPVHGRICAFLWEIGSIGQFPKVLITIFERGGEDNKMVDEDLRSEIERLRAENEALKKSSSKGLSLRVSEKGAVSVYGLGRFPVTLYKEQWLRLIDMAEEIRTFIKQNEAQLKSKAQPQS